MDEANVIKFQAQVIKLQTMSDDSFRITLEFGVQDVEAFVKLVRANVPGVLLEIAAVAVQVA